MVSSCPPAGRGLNTVQVLVSLVVIALFVPCIANLLVIINPMCRTEIDAGATQQICGACPLGVATEGCRLDLVPCPVCGYHSLAREHEGQGGEDVEPFDLGSGRELPTVEETSGALRLSELPAGTAARLLGFSDLVKKDLGRLTAHGLLPGVRVEVLQRVPAVILAVYQTELAVEARLAAGVWVAPLQAEA